MPDTTIVLEAARTVMDKAYAPYSRFPVGAVIVTDTGHLYAGCNVENASYPVGSCAEQNAIGAMIAGGDKVIAAIYVMGNGANPVSPCGACRQRIREFAAPDAKIYICDRDGIRETFSMSEILPCSFGPENLADAK